MRPSAGARWLCDPDGPRYQGAAGGFGRNRTLTSLFQSCSS